MSVSKETRLNGAITNAAIRLIDVDGKNVGVVDKEEALAIAAKAELDLVEIVPNADPPVCRVMDYGKFKFEQSKKGQQARKKQKHVLVKEMKFRPGTEENDYQVKLQSLIRFLTDGNKAKVTIRFKGREMTHQELGVKQLERIQADLIEYGEVEQEAKLEGRQLTMVLAPKKSGLKKAAGKVKKMFEKKDVNVEEK
ncbi:MAG: translation initiation factor IF-3 [Pseudomonadota bacterium]